jgi:hypothetical protein
MVELSEMISELNSLQPASAWVTQRQERDENVTMERELAYENHHTLDIIACQVLQ